MFVPRKGKDLPEGGCVSQWFQIGRFVEERIDTDFVIVRMR